jgi:alkanesulfonate monooxygenase SsuD/methylene tetrahydromethanopterin reductase-like flavin-dependent oxidoreductase (luciferase family)
MPDPLSFGISLPNRAVLFGVPFEDLVATAEAAEATGQFDSVWVGDNLVSKPRLECIATLTALAMRTERMRLGTICFATFALRDPLLLALQWASLDVISQGRAHLAVCNGGSAHDGPAWAAELAMMGVKSEERVARVEEGIELLRAFWTGEPVTYDGRFRSYSDVTVLPKPVQDLPPIVIAANPSEARNETFRERIMRRIARFGDGWQCDGIPLDVFRESLLRMQEMAMEEGRPHALDHVSLHIMVNIDDDVEKGRQGAAQFLDHYYGSTGGVDDEKFADWVAFGPPERVAEKLQSYVDAGCTTPVLRFASSDQLGQLARCSEEVLPLLGRPAGVAV